jgi:cell fate regulator YaaT (PSP1 superfamily)
MTSEKPEKKISYFPRSWGARRKGGSGRHAARKEEPAQAPPSVDLVDDGVQDYTETPQPPPCDAPSALLGDLDICDATDEAPCRCCEDRVCPELYDEDADASNELEACDDLAAIVDAESVPWTKTAESAFSSVGDSEAYEVARVSVNILGVRFGYAGRIYHFDATDLELAMGDWVLVKTEKGLGLGQVAVPPMQREINAVQLEGLRKVIRKATKADFDQKMRCVRREKEAYTYCQEMIETLGLPMKLVTTECFFDGSKYVFYFTAEGRVDFRELVKLLVARFPVRIEMRQIGVRHEAKMTGGLACCGEELCCSRFLTDFRPVSVKMAKTQNLSLNPTKISGVCGRLMCCLAYEYDVYDEFRKGLPKVGKKVNTSKGEGVILKHDPLTETILVRIDEETTLELTKAQLLAEDPPPPPKRSKKKS